jgi:hypothetical protein
MVVAVMMPCLLLCGGGSSMSLVWARADLCRRARGQRWRWTKWCSVGVGFVSLMPRLFCSCQWRWRKSSGWLCYCRPLVPFLVWCTSIYSRVCFATVYGVGGLSLLCQCGPAGPCLRVSSLPRWPYSVCHGESMMVTEDRGGACWCAPSLVECYRLF